MTIGVNEVVLMGRLGNDPKVTKNNQGTIANISLATGSSYNDKNTGQRVESTEWHKVVFFRRLAEVVEKYLRKGHLIYVKGYLRTRKWQDKGSGEDRYTTEIVARSMQMLGGKSEGSEQAPHQNSQANSEQQYNADTWGSTPPMGAQFDDDIPF